MKGDAMKRHKWIVWTEEHDDETVFTTVFTGSRSACLSYYKKHGGSKAGYHFGYELDF